MILNSLSLVWGEKLELKLFEAFSGLQMNSAEVLEGVVCAGM